MLLRVAKQTRGKILLWMRAAFFNANCVDQAYKPDGFLKLRSKKYLR